jgi:cell division protein FtsZ
LEETSIMGARAVLINITGSREMGLHEICEAAKIVQESADAEANIIFGSVFDDRLGDKIKITVIATGFEQDVPHQLHSATRSAATALGTPVPPKEMCQTAVAEATGTDGRDSAFDVALIKEDLDIPAFMRKRAN